MTREDERAGRLSLSTAVRDMTLEDAFETIRRAVRNERERTETEQRAFEQFETHVEQIDAPAADVADPRVAGGANVMSARGRVAGSPDQAAAALQKIRRAYQETVMTVPFYEEEYGEPYVESIRKEFSPEVATTLTDPCCFGPTAKQALLSKIRRAQEAREQLRQSCENERNSVDMAATTLVPIAATVHSVQREALEQQQSGTIDEYHERLNRWQKQCNQVAESRQGVIKRQRRNHQLEVDAADLTQYLYEELEIEYPILFFCSDLAHVLKQTRNQVVQATMPATPAPRREY